MTTDSKPPYLTIVATSRNDNHGGDMTKRMRIFLRCLIRHCNEHQLPCELIMVEWNPPADRPILKDELTQPVSGDYLSVRYIQVPKEEHDKLNFSERIPLFQMIAKNVGIRRASAEFVLCTNVDLLFSNALFEWLKSRPLKNGHHYRANRCDIPSTIDESLLVEQQLAFAEANILSRAGKKQTRFKKYSMWIRRQLKSELDFKAGRLDRDACGDFTLMSKEDWIRIEGYPELEVYSLHIDSMALYAAEAIGIEQVILEPNRCTFHIEHGDGWRKDAPMEMLMLSTTKPTLEWESVHEVGLEAIRTGTTYGLNRPNWGLNDINLTEYRFN